MILCILFLVFETNSKKAENVMDQDDGRSEGSSASNCFLAIFIGSFGPVFMSAKQFLIKYFKETYEEFD